MQGVNRTGRAAAGVLPAVLVAVVIAVLALFAPTTTASATAPARGDVGLGAAVPSVFDSDSVRWTALRQVRGIAGVTMPHDQVPAAVPGLAGAAAVVLVLLGACPPRPRRVRRAAAVRLPGARAPPAPGD
jgi:hypothetical protein